MRCAQVVPAPGASKMNRPHEKRRRLPVERTRLAAHSSGAAPGSLVCHHRRASSDAPGHAAVPHGRRSPIPASDYQRRTAKQYSGEPHANLLREHGGAGVRRAAGARDGSLQAGRAAVRRIAEPVPTHTAACLGAAVDPVAGHRHAVGRFHHISGRVFCDPDQHHRRRAIRRQAACACRAIAGRRADAA